MTAPMTSPSDTPRTDEVIRRAEDAESWEDTAVAIARLSQQLERDLSCHREENARILAELARVTAERDAALADARRYRERGVLAAHSGENDRREWRTASEWLYPGDELCLIDAAMQERNDA